MQNIPVFTAANGMASLILREIPYSGAAYVMVRSVWGGKTAALLEECASFCRAVGAQRVYASDGNNDLPAEHAYDMVKLTAQRENLPALEQPVLLEAISAKNGAEYLNVYNTCFRDLPGAASYGKKDLQRLIERSSGFLTRKDGVCVGVVELEGDELAGICVLPEHKGLGYDLALTALHRLQSPAVRVKTASTNERALSLYRRLGFGNETCISRWWRL